MALSDMSYGLFKWVIENDCLEIIYLPLGCNIFSAVAVWS